MSKRDKRNEGEKRNKKRERDECKKDDNKSKKRKTKKDDEDPDDVDEYGNIKDLIDYESEQKDVEVEDESEEESDEESEDEKCQAKENTRQISPVEIFFNTVLAPPRRPIHQSKHDIMKKKIDDSTMSDEMKNKLKKKLEKSSLDEKQEEWFDTLLSVPFGKYSQLPIDAKKDDVGKYFENLVNTLNKTVYGMNEVKEKIVDYVAKCLTSSSPPEKFLALQGCAGIGKTRIIKDGISKALNRPIKSFSLGGSKDSNQFLGFEYTYQNSRWGSIVNALIDSEVMNPIFFFDELDKLSFGHDGKELSDVLIHVTDPVTNNDFNKDKYFDGVSFDLSKVLFIFAFNNIEDVNPILLDRLDVIQLPSPSEKDKLIIARDYIIDELLLKNTNVSKKDFTITDKAIEHIIRNYSKSEGVRTLKRCIETILDKVNMVKLLGDKINNIKLSFKLKDYSLPVKIDERNVDVFLKSFKKDRGDEKHLSMYV